MIIPFAAFYDSFDTVEGLCLLQILDGYDLIIILVAQLSGAAMLHSCHD
jgi:hypothetical protein